MRQTPSKNSVLMIFQQHHNDGTNGLLRIARCSLATSRGRCGPQMATWRFKGIVSSHSERILSLEGLVADSRTGAESATPADELSHDRDRDPFPII